ncbi:MAG: capsular polysaccharide biosynthesis protein [Oscillospiraceae bacterium]|nr:capsular polysaccharide biosynthesis protein [Oscillospiraceae bacterium]
MLTEYHCHVLPGIDDGSDSVETSLAMLSLMQAQGVERVVFTPHFYAHREASVEAFLEKRQAAFEAIRERSPIREMHLGAEVAIEHGLSELPGIEKLAVSGTRMILLELPYREFRPWMPEEVYNLTAEFGLKAVMAHIHRYLAYYNKEEMERILDLNAVFQINNEAFGSLSQRSFVKKLIRQEYPLVFGSDAHDMKERRPNWDLLLRKCDSAVIEQANRRLERYRTE